MGHNAEFDNLEAPDICRRNQCISQFCVKCGDLFTGLTSKCLHFCIDFHLPHVNLVFIVLCHWSYQFSIGIRYDYKLSGHCSWNLGISRVSYK